MDSNHDVPALQSAMDFAPEDDKRLATDLSKIMQSKTPNTAFATDRPSTPPNQQQNPDTRPRSILKRQSSDLLRSTMDQDSPTAAEGRRKVRFSSVDEHYEMVDEDRPRRSSTASPPPPGNHEDRESEDDEDVNDHLDSDDEDEEASKAAIENDMTTHKASESSKALSELHHIFPNNLMDHIDFSDEAAVKETSEKLRLATPQQLVDPVNESIKKMQELKHRETITRLSKETNEEAREKALDLEKKRYEEECLKREHANIVRQLIAARDSEGYDPNADVDPPSPSPTVESPSRLTGTSHAEGGHQTAKATTATPSGGVTVVGSFNFDRFKGTFSSSNVRVVDSEGYDANADVDPPSDEEQDDDAVEAASQAPMKIFTAGSTALPKSIKTTKQTSPESQPAEAIPSTPISAAVSVSEPTKTPPKPLTTGPTFPHTRETDDMIRHLRSSGQPFSAIADRVNETFASQNLVGRIEGNGVYSRLVMLNHLHGGNDENRTGPRQSTLFTARTPAPQTGNAMRKSDRKRTTFSAKDDEALVRIYNERSSRFWDDVASDMEKETGRKFDKRELEERYAAL